MWIEISKDVFKNSDFKSLNYLYQILSWYPEKSVPRYKLFIDLAIIKDFENYRKIKEVETGFDELIEREFDEFVNSKPSGAPRDYKITKQKKKNHFNVEEAIRFFNQPVSIILENNKNDSCFIIAIINYFDSIGKVKSHYKNGWIKFENAGGCGNIENFLKGFLHVFEDLALKNNRNLSDYFRGLIILDSDLEYPKQPSKQEALIEKLIAQKDKKGAANLYVLESENIHVLEKRMMENYLPDEVFEDLKNSSSNKNLIPWINTYLNLKNNSNGEEQRDFLDIKKGFPKNKDGTRKPMKEEVLELFDIPQKNIEILDKGFNYPDFKNKYPLLFLNSTNVNKYTLNQRCGTGELQDIFDKISKLL